MTSLTNHDPGSSSRLGQRGPVPEADLSAYVLAAVDEHLAALAAIRRQLVMSRPVEPGARWNAAALSVLSARRYADDVASALGIEH